MKHVLLAVILALSSLSPCFARVGETLPELIKRYGEPVSSGELGTAADRINFRIPGSNNAIVCFVNKQTHLSQFEMVPTLVPENVVKIIAGDNPVEVLSDKTISDLKSAGKVNTQVVAMWQIKGDPATFATLAWASKTAVLTFGASSDFSELDKWLASLISGKI